MDRVIRRSRGYRTTIAFVVGLVVLGVSAIVLVLRTRFHGTIEALVDDLPATPASSGNAAPGPTVPAGAVVTDDDLERLPAPVRRYLEAVLADGRPDVTAVRLDQRGELRLGASPDAWRPFRAVQHVAVRPPGFVWDATVSVLPLLPVRVVDAYVGGEGVLRARLLSAIPVADADPGPEMNAGELLRFLGESVWYPTALLADAVTWVPVDDRSARATIEHRGTSASLVFRFDNDHLVESVHAEERYRREDGRRAPWTGYFSGYEVWNGLLVPMEAEVEWTLPEGTRPYWRGTVESIDHEFASRR